MSASTAAPRRPLIRYHGGKWNLAPWIIAHFPPHRVYVEPFGGAASVLLRKSRSYAEVYNDLDGEIVNLFRVTRDQGTELVRALELTPFARDEYYAAFAPTDDPVELARRVVIRSFMGFGSDSILRSRRSGFRSTAERSGTTPAHDWQHFPGCLPAIIERLRGVVIENRPAIQVMREHDGPRTLHYCDPPYLPETRTTLSHQRAAYEQEMTEDDHRQLAAGLRDMRGMVVLSGYPSPLYEELYADWERVERPALADGAKPRTEVLWLRNVDLTPLLTAEGEHEQAPADRGRGLAAEGRRARAARRPGRGRERDLDDGAGALRRRGPGDRGLREAGGRGGGDRSAAEVTHRRDAEHAERILSWAGPEEENPSGLTSAYSASLR